MTAKKRSWLWPIVGTFAAHLLLVVLLLWQGVIGNPFANPNPQPKTNSSATAPSKTGTQPDSGSAASKAVDPGDTRIQDIARKAMAEQQALNANMSTEQLQAKIERQADFVKSFKDVENAANFVGSVGGFKPAIKVRGTEPDPGPFDEKSAKYIEVDDSRTDPKTGEKIIRFTLRDKGYRTRSFDVPIDDLTRNQTVQYSRLLRKKTDPDEANLINMAGFDFESSRHYTVDDTQTDKRTGQKVYEFTYIDKNGRLMKHRVRESQMTKDDRQQLRLLKMKKENPNFGQIYDAAQAIMHQLQQQRDRQAAEARKRKLEQEKQAKQAQVKPAQEQNDQKK